MKGINTHLGYLSIDNRDAPPVAPRPGFFCATTSEVIERDTYTCPHCMRQVIRNPLRTSTRNVCRKCMRVTCDSAACLIDCFPMEKTFDLVTTIATRNPDRSHVQRAIDALRRSILGHD